MRRGTIRSRLELVAGVRAPDGLRRHSRHALDHVREERIETSMFSLGRGRPTSRHQVRDTHALTPNLRPNTHATRPTPAAHATARTAELTSATSDGGYPSSRRRIR